MSDSFNKTGDDLAQEALSAAGQPATATGAKTANSDLDEVAASDQLAQTLQALQNVIERNATELERVLNELKEKREMFNNIFDNDTELAEASAQAQVFTEQVKARKSKLQTDPQSTTLKVQIGELAEQKKEIEEALSNHLVNYHQITGSKSFDTSDGDQWDFEIRAKVKTRKK